METANAKQSNDEPKDGKRVVLEIDRRRPLMRMDFTLNIPTIVSIVALICTTGAAGITVYNNLDRRQLETTYALHTAEQRIEKVEKSVADLKIEQVERNTQLRTEIKGDISEIKGLLNEVIFGRGHQPSLPQQEALNKWRK